MTTLSFTIPWVSSRAIQEFETAKEFFESRGKKLPLKERVHAIWLCIKVPHAGSRVLEEGDTEFLKLAAAAAKVPVVAVFTQFDILYSRMERALTDEEMKLPADQFSGYAHKELRRSSRQYVYLNFKIWTQLHDMRELPIGLGTNSSPDHHALAELIRTTLHLLGETSCFAGKILMNVKNAHNRETVSITSAIAQRGSAQAKGSINTGFSGFKLEKCLNTVHIDIVTAWNFGDPNKLLRSTAFVEKMRTITQVVVPREDEANDWFGTVKGVMSAAGTAGTIHPIAFPIVAGIGLSGIFINWLATVYKRTPETLRLFMGYLVGLTLVLDQLFVIVLALGSPNLLT
ncbi:hypothetical protein C8J57DRAFT_1479902 [Mycena rebaudengoi]|nr:hypothetical protein C8J57DRAFT_1479902 [Mycena rebaudengoi]